jgi:transposase
VHSRYRRRVTDLPLSGRIVRLVVIARRFRCDAVLCGRQIFTERFPEGALAPSARRTARLDCIVHHLGLVLGGRPAASFAKRLMLPVSNDTLLRVVRRRIRPPTELLRVVGIDDWAWRRNHRYASIICNLERRRIVTLLPDREPATAQAWFAAHPTIGIVARDRGGGYGEAAAKALPHALQVADRWHLSTPEQKCIGWPEQKYISDAGKKAPELGAFSSGIKARRDCPPAFRSWHGVSGSCSD